MAPPEKEGGEEPPPPGGSIGPGQGGGGAGQSVRVSGTAPILHVIKGDQIVKMRGEVVD